MSAVAMKSQGRRNSKWQSASGGHRSGMERVPMVFGGLL